MTAPLPHTLNRPSTVLCSVQVIQRLLQTVDLKASLLLTESWCFLRKLGASELLQRSASLPNLPKPKLSENTTIFQKITQNGGFLPNLTQFSTPERLFWNLNLYSSVHPHQQEWLTSRAPDWCSKPFQPFSNCYEKGKRWTRQDCAVPCAVVADHPIHSCFLFCTKKLKTFESASLRLVTITIAQLKNGTLASSGAVSTKLMKRYTRTTNEIEPKEAPTDFNMSFR